MNINSLLAQILCGGRSETLPQFLIFFLELFLSVWYLSVILVWHTKSCNPFQTKPIFIVMQSPAQQRVGPWRCC